MVRQIELQLDLKSSLSQLNSVYIQAVFHFCYIFGCCLLNCESVLSSCKIFIFYATKTAENTNAWHHVEKSNSASSLVYVVLTHDLQFLKLIPLKSCPTLSTLALNICGVKIMAILDCWSSHFQCSSRIFSSVALEWLFIILGSSKQPDKFLEFGVWLLIPFALKIL